MKTIIKSILPCLALLILISGKPFDKPEVVAKVKWPTSVSTSPAPGGGDCVSNGTMNFCLYWSGTLNYARFITNGGFTFNSTNQTAVSGGSHCWNITVGDDSIFYNIEGSMDGVNWELIVANTCIRNCNGHECA